MRENCRSKHYYSAELQSRTSCGKQNGVINHIYGDINDVPGAGGGPEARKETVVLKGMYHVCMVAWC